MRVVENATVVTNPEKVTPLERVVTFSGLLTTVSFRCGPDQSELLQIHDIVELRNRLTAPCIIL